jgi:hypothetical protein
MFVVQRCFFDMMDLPESDSGCSAVRRSAGLLYFENVDDSSAIATGQKPKTNVYS